MTLSDPPRRSEPPYVPIRSSRWPIRHTPRWLLVAIAAVVAVTVVVSLVHKPSTAERAADLRGFLSDVTADIESCAAGVGESLSALHQVQAVAYRNSTEVSEGISVAEQGAANCAPANNEQIDDLENYQVAESLASFNLGGVVTNLVAWAAPDAQQVQTDVATLLAARTPAAKARANRALQQAIDRLNAKRHAIYAVLKPAIKSLHAHAAPPGLPG